MTVITAPTTNTKLLNWVSEWAEILQPDEIYWCDGSEEEYDRLAEQLVDIRYYYLSYCEPKQRWWFW